MAADLDKLVPAMKPLVIELTDRCKTRGVEMRPNIGLRDPFEQARLWRQSRSREQIAVKLEELQTAGASFLAHCLDSVGPQHGEHVTDTPPGFSWHQWGEALDYFWVVDEDAEWSTQRLVNGVNGYHVLANEAETIGLTAGGHWKKFKDWPHVQLRGISNAGTAMSIAQIDAEMKARFGR